MKSNLKHLLLLASLSATMAACTPNPVNNKGGTGAYPPGNTNAGGSINTGGMDTSGNTNTNASGSISTGTDVGDHTNNGSMNTDGNTNTGHNTENVTDGTNASDPKQRRLEVQLTASISQQKAEAVKNTFVAEGYPVIQNNVETNGQVLYRVQIGPYATQGEAKAVLNKMKKRYRRNTYVNAAIINENK
jgi:hypothetical protein